MVEAKGSLDANIGDFLFRDIGSKEFLIEISFLEVDCGFNSPVSPVSVLCGLSIKTTQGTDIAKDSFVLVKNLAIFVFKTWQLAFWDCSSHPKLH